MGKIIFPEDMKQIDLLDRQRMIQSQAYNKADEATAQRVGNLTRSYPNISPGLAFALGASGIGVGQQAQDLWQQDLAVRLDSQPGSRTGNDYSKRGQSWLLKRARKGDDRAKTELVNRLTGEGFSPFGAIGEGIGKAAELINPAIPHEVKTGVRDVLTGAQAGIEGVAGASRTGYRYLLGGPFNEETNDPTDVVTKVPEQTTLYHQVVEGKSTGTGFFPSPESEAAKAQAESARQFSPYLIGGHAWTPGRATASMVFEPDDDKFNLLSGIIDGYVALQFDPANVALGISSDYRKAQKLVAADELIDAGVVKGSRYGFAPQRFSTWAEKPSSREAFQAIADDKSAYSIWRATKIKDAGLLREYANADSADEVLAITKAHIGGAGLPHGVSYEPPKVRNPFLERMGTDVPASKVTIRPGADLMDALTEIDNSLVNIHGTHAVRERIFNEVINSADDIMARDAAMRGVYDAHSEILKAAGVSDELVQQTRARAFNEAIDDKDYVKDVISGQTLFDPDQVQVGSKAYRIADAATQDLLIDGEFLLPDFRALRREMSPFREIMTHPLYTGTVEVVDELMRYWRRLAIARIATGLRVVGEEQLRMAFDGYDSLVKHPMSALAYAIGSPDSTWVHTFNKRPITAPIASVLEEFGTKFGKKPYLLGENDIDSPLFKALYPRFGAVTGNDRKILLAGETELKIDDPATAPALAEELMHLRENQIVRSLITRGVEDTKQAFWDGDLVPQREFLSTTPTLAALKNDRIVADAEIDKYVNLLADSTGNHPDLIGAVDTGFIRNARVMNPNGPNRKGVNAIRDILANDESLPKTFHTSRYRLIGESQQHRVLRRLDNGFNAVLDTVLSRPSNFFSRGVLKEQEYLASMKEAFPYMDKAGRARLLSHLEEANLPKRVREEFRFMDSKLNRIEDFNAGPQKFLTKAQYEAKQAAGLKPLEHTISFEAANMIASRRAVNKTRDLLYDLSKKSQFFDSMRTVFPFGEAWKEVITRWIKITQENPRVIRRLQQGLWAAQSPGSDVINTATGNPSSGQGFLMQDDHGQEVFAYPLSGWLSSKTPGLGAPIPLTGSVSGLNMIGNGLPGFGPVVQIPVSYFLPDKPQFDDIRTMINPTGTSSAGDPINTTIDAFMPSWFNKLRKGFFANANSDRIFAGTVFDVARYLQSTGDYHIQGPNAQNEINRLMSDAKKKARVLYMVRGLGQATLPSAPSPEWLVKDKKGQSVIAWRATKKYQEWVDKLGYDAAYTKFLDYFGTDNFLLVQGKSKAVIPNAPVKSDAYDWARKNPDMKSKYPHAYGLFAPTTGDFSIQAYQKSLEHGERKSLTPEEMVSAANSRLATIVYNKAKSELGPKITKVEELTLRNLRTELVGQFPGYMTEQPSFTQRKVIISELEAAADDPKLRSTPAGKALRKYLIDRDNTLLMIGGTGLTSAKNSFERLNLMQYGEALVDKYPEFQMMWDTTFKQELGDF